MYYFKKIVFLFTFLIIEEKKEPEELTQECLWCWDAGILCWFYTSQFLLFVFIFSARMTRHIHPRNSVPHLYILFGLPDGNSIIRFHSATNKTIIVNRFSGIFIYYYTRIASYYDGFAWVLHMAV